jgi:hypothetical protein
MFLCTSLYFLVGILGYLRVGSAAASFPNILVYYDANMASAVAARIASLVQMLLGYSRKVVFFVLLTFCQQQKKNQISDRCTCRTNHSFFLFWSCLEILGERGFYICVDVFNSAACLCGGQHWVCAGVCWRHRSYGIHLYISFHHVGEKLFVWMGKVGQSRRVPCVYLLRAYFWSSSNCHNICVNGVPPSA